MAAPPPPLAFDTSFRPEIGAVVDIAPGIQRLTAPNAGPYTFSGTNSFLIGGAKVAIVDPGPDDDHHFKALIAAIDGRVVEAIILTHTHRDHSALVPRLKALTGAPLWFEGRHRLSRKRRPFEINPISRACDWGLAPDRALGDGEMFAVGGVSLTAIKTPGHCANHLCFGVNGTDLLLSGDHVMGWNSTLVAVPDGSMGDYLSSLEKLIALPWRQYQPAHGGPITDGPGYARALLGHRRLRNSQIFDKVGGGVTTIAALQKSIYPLLSPLLALAARMTLTAHIEYLEAEGALRVERSLGGTKLAIR